MTTPTKFQQRPARPNSPLPDSSVLEAGLLTDENDVAMHSPSTTIIYDQVRDLLRNSVFGRIEGSPGSVPSPPAVRRALSSRADSPEASPVARGQREGGGVAWNASMSVAATAASEQLQQQQLGSGIEVIADEKVVLEGPRLPALTYKPVSKKRPVVPAPANVQPAAAVTGTLFPPLRPVQPSDHSSTLFNTRAFQALNHPDLNDPSMDFLTQPKIEADAEPPKEEQRQGTVRLKPQPGSQRKKSSGRAAREAARRATNQTIVSVFAALFLGGLVATYLAFAFGKPAEPHGPIFHVLFALGITAATVILGWTIWRLFRLKSKSASASRRGRHHHRRRQSDEENLLWVERSERGDSEVSSHRSTSTRHQHRHRGRQHSRRRVASPTNNKNERPVPPPLPAPPVITIDTNFGAFMPTEPIQIQPTAAVTHMPGTATTNAAVDDVNEWNKPTAGVVHPPPAYGRWRGSVLANPDLLHWEAVHSPSEASPDAEPALPSPAYRAERDEGDHYKQVPTIEVTHHQSAESLPPMYTSPLRIRPAVAETIQVQAVDPEMIEIRMVGVGRGA